MAVAEELNFGRAAKRLRISQQPLSQQIKRLEAELGVELFRRTTRRVELTGAGEAFLDEAYRTLSQGELAVEAARRAARGEAGALRIGYAPAALYGPLPAALRAFRASYPGVVLELTESLSTAQEEALVSGRIDAGFLYPPVGDPAVAWETVLEEPLVAALPADHPLAGRGVVELKELSEEPFVLMPRRNRPLLHDRIVAECFGAGFSPKVSQEAGGIQALLGLVAAGFGVGLVLGSFRDLRRPGVVYLSLKEPGEKIALAAAWRRGDASPALANFLFTVREAAASFTG